MIGGYGRRRVIGHRRLERRSKRMARTFPARPRVSAGDVVSPTLKGRAVKAGGHRARWLRGMGEGVHEARGVGDSLTSLSGLFETGGRG